MKKVFVDVAIERCTACKSCEIACAVEHSSSRNLFAAIFETPAPKKRIHVEKALSFSYPAKCMHCVDAPCIMACPTGAMCRDPEVGSVMVNEDRCMGCWMCAMVCPFGAISTDSEKGIAVKCDFCKSRLKEGKDPACVEVCPTHALSCGEPEELSKEKRLHTAQRVAVAVCMEKEERSKTTPLDILREFWGLKKLRYS